MRLVIAGVDEAGRSYVHSESHLSGEVPNTLWFGGHPSIRSALARLDESAALSAIEPEPGEIRWRISVFPPNSIATLPDVEGFDDAGMHFTRTVDYDFVVEGPVTCRLDSGDVELNSGDAILLPAARHAWENTTDASARVLICMFRP